MRFEYKTIKLATGGLLGGKFDASSLDAELNRLGEQGWELTRSLDTNSMNGQTRDIVAILKRRRE